MQDSTWLKTNISRWSFFGDTMTFLKAEGKISSLNDVLAILAKSSSNSL